jgi:DNA-directed RNA polymerase subunit K/omega
MSLVRPITRRDIKGPALYGPIRDDYRRHVIEMKRARRILIGDRVSLVFENRHTLSVQIEEICRVENLTRDDQIEHEIAIYNQLMPTESSLSATLFIELPPDADAYVALKDLVGLDEHVVLHIGSHAIRAQFEAGRSTEDRISAVQYTRYPLSAEARSALLTPGTKIAVSIDHPNYTYRVECSEDTRASLAGDYA